MNHSFFRRPVRRVILAVAAIFSLSLAALDAPSVRAQNFDPLPANANLPGSAPITPVAPAAPRAGTATTTSTTTTTGGTASDPNAALGGNANAVRQAEQGPIEIASDAGTNYQNTPQGRIATFTGAVNIVTNDASIYCDRADYNADTHEGLLTGGVRIYRNDTVLVAERAIYNFNTKAIRALDLAGEKPPYEFSSVGVFSPGQGLQYNLRNAQFTTDDRSTPDFHLSSRRVRIYPDDRIVYIGSTLYIGTTPVFYFPYFYQSLDQQSGYQVTPGYSSVYGAFLLTGVTFPVSDHVTGLLRLDYRTSRGFAGGLNFEYKPNRRKKVPPSSTNIDPYASDDDEGVAAAGTFRSSPNNPTTPSSNVTAGGFGASSGTLGAGANTTPEEGARAGFAATGLALSRQIRNKEGSELLTYYIHDDKSDLNRTTLDREPIDQDRYRIKLSSYNFITDDFYFKIDADKISDRYLLQDFYEGEFTKNPNPENVASLTYIHPNFIATLTGRLQANEFFDTTERLPELAFEMPRVPLGNTGLFYETTNSAGYLRRAFDNDSPLPEYSALRIDTFHQISLPETLFGWLNVVPRTGIRGTYYSRSAPDNTPAYALQFANDTNIESLLSVTPLSASDLQLKSQQDLRNQIAAFKTEGDIVRPVFNAGFDASFKLSRVYDNVESRIFGLDRLQHIVQPYMDFQYVEDFGYGSRRLLQFDRLLPTTQLQPIDFPQFNSIDTIDENTAVRVGVRNRLQTKRDALTFDWMELDTFFQANIYQPDQVATFANTRSTFSNLFNQFTFRPVPWVNLTIDSQLPVFSPKTGFTEVDTALQFQATSNLDLTISHRYLDHNPFFKNSSLLRFNAYYRIDDNWAAGFSERYEFADHLLQAQSYTLYRDLSAFVGSLGITVRNNNGVSDYGVVLNFTLKGLPKVSLPVGFDVNSLDNQLAQ